MPKNLIIVESYTKTKTISKYLNQNNDSKYIVTYSQGHFCDLPKNDLGINLDNWKGNYITTKNNITNNILKLLKDVDIVYIASDPDIEGEAIAYHISKLIKNKKYYRIKFNEITKSAILTAINNPSDIDLNMVKAQETRRFLDRIVGFKLSPILWNKFNDNTLSVGRVQSVALLFCINRLKQIKEHNIEKFWTLKGIFKCNKIELDATSIKINKENELVNILNILSNHKNKFTIEFTKKEQNDIPPPPYTTTTLQQDAYNILHYNSKKTMELAQKLYESGLITYMRTDSVNISDNFKYKLKDYITEKYGKEYHNFRNYKNKIKNAQEAHEAVRISNLSVEKLEVNSEFTDNHVKLYDLIRKRTLACQMNNAIYTMFEIVIKCKDYIFNTNKRFLTSLGYLIIYNKELEEFNDFINNLNNIKPLSFEFVGDITKPKTLYSEVSLIKELESNGIGRPSTYAQIIDKILIKKYVIKSTNPVEKIEQTDYIKKINKEIKIKKKTIDSLNKGKDLLKPTELGINSIEYLITIIPFLLDIDFTSQMEVALDKISNGELTKEMTLSEFYNKIKPLIDKYCNKENNFKSREDGIIKSKYGYCYYHKKENRYLNIEPYLTWKKINAENLTEIDINFLKTLPKKIDDKHELHLGKYGLYLKDIINNNNIKIDKNKWNDYISN